MKPVQFQPSERIPITRPQQAQQRKGVRLFLIRKRITRISIVNDQTEVISDRVLDVKEPYWRVRYLDEDCEELKKEEIERHKTQPRIRSSPETLPVVFDRYQDLPCRKLEMSRYITVSCRRRHWNPTLHIPFRPCCINLVIRPLVSM